MYENSNYSNDNENRTNTLATKEQIKAKKKAERKAASKKTWKKIGTAAILGVTFGVLAAGSFQFVNRMTNFFFPVKAVNEAPHEEGHKIIPEEKKVEVPQVKIAPDESVKENNIKVMSGSSVTDVVDNAMPSIVSITNKSVQQVRSMFGMGIQEYENTSVGSGIIIGQNDDELLIVTNNHVVEGANSLTVGFVDDEIYDAHIKGTESDRDLAVIAVNISDVSDDTLGKISVAVMGNSDELKVGEQVVAIGNALGYGQSVTTGIISALDREVTIENITNNLIQTDAAINPGNSGGALLDMQGKVIGINSAKLSSAAVEGIGYAIPVNTVQPIVEGLMNRETREILEEADAGYLGISGLNVDASVSMSYGIPEGVYLQEVMENSPAEKAGLIKGDVIKKFDGTSVKTISELKKLLLYYKPGESVEVVYYRSDDGEYEERTATVKLADRKGTALDPDAVTDEDSVKKEDSQDDSKNEYDGNEDGYENDTQEKGNRGNDMIQNWNSLFDMFGF